MNTTSVNDVYKTPKADLIEESHDENALQFFGVSIKKLCVMYIFTMGLYSLVYFYQHWKVYKIQNNLRINPVLRAIFAILFVYSLFQKIGEKAKERNIAQLPAFSALAVLYVISSIISSVVSSVPGYKMEAVIGTGVGFAFTLIELYPLYRVQLVANTINNDEKGTINARFTAVNWAFIVLGALMWIATIIGSYVQFSAIK